MADVTFYHNERVDGGRRTGLTVDGRRALEVFVPGPGEPDPVLRWYVEVRQSVDPPPPTVEDAAEWLTAHAGPIRDALADAADRLAGGLDADIWPWGFDRPGPDGAVRVSVSVMRGEAGRGVGGRIRGVLATDWPKLLEHAAAGAPAGV